MLNEYIVESQNTRLKLLKALKNVLRAKSFKTGVVQVYQKLKVQFKLYRFLFSFKVERFEFLKARCSVI